MKEETKRKIVRGILSSYYNTKGFLFYLVYLSHPLFVGRTFYSKPMKKDYQLKKGLHFMAQYEKNFMGFFTYNRKEIVLTFKDLGLYNLKLQKKYGK